MSIEIQASEPPAPEPDRTGEVVGSYKLLDVLGQGAMGRVYLAEHTVIHRKVALKMLRHQHASDPLAVQRFFAEARAVNRISHENIVEITDFIENPGGDNCFVMELLRGESLKTRLEREHPLPLEAGLRITLQVARALSAVQGANLVHRDLKPDNIYLCERENRKDFVKLLDFGVAKNLDLAAEGALQKTNAGSILGTPEYMSPEQLAGKQVDARSDIYSFGILAYEVFTGRRPFEAKSFGELVIKHLTQPAPRPAKLKELAYPLPKALEDAIMQCLSKTPEGRPQTMVEVVTTLESISGAMSQGERLVMAKPGISRTAAMLAATSTLGLFGGLIAAALSTRSVDGQAVAQANQPADETPAVPTDTQIALDSAPTGAAVTIDGVTAGTTPLRTRLSRGEHKLKLTLEGYDPLERSFEVGADAQTIGLALVKTVIEPTPAEASKVAAKSVKGEKKATGKPQDALKDTNAVLDPFGD